ncbi:MAG: protein tyrosine phosphatase [Rhodobacteraceae bacterium CG2_30_10_405]|nr:MAG: protein tyrosine phosphatase [Rhodobacteraceae bacterium CG2_30_10_405]
MWRIVKWVGRALAVAAVLVLALVVYLGGLHLTGNFHTVIAGELYRSAQLEPDQIEAHHASEGIASILNLRGPAPGKDWYDAEIATSARLGITHADFGMSARRILEPEKVQELIALMRRLPKPLLIHCQAGADRSGLASALYLAAIKGRPEAEPGAQISIRYGHFSIPNWSAAYPMDLTWQGLAPSLGYVTP